MDNKDLTVEDVKDALKQSHSQPIGGLHREVDSLDDFEHLGHDSSPLKDAGDLLSAARDGPGVINKGDDKAATAANPIFPQELSSFDPLHTDHKMDSNLLEMGDNFPDRKEADAKLDKFLQDLGSMAPPKHEEPPEIHNKDEKSATQTFMDFEREVSQPKKVDTTNDLLEKYSDSEPDNDDDFKPSKYQDFPKKAELPESISSDFKTDTFKDLDDEPQLPKRDYPSGPVPEPEKVTPVPPKEEKPVPVKVKTPEPVKKKLPEPAEVICRKPELDKKKKAAVIDAEAIFCKMGLGRCMLNCHIGMVSQVTLNLERGNPGNRCYQSLKCMIHQSTWNSGK